MRKWEDALKEHKQAILDKGYKEEQLLGIFLYGSQNYGCETEESDVDTKAIYIPTFEELCFDDPVSKEICLKNDEHCEIKDIREMVKNFQKQNINFLEILFTDKCWINPRFRDIWDKYFYQHREEIARYNPKKMLDSICGQAVHTLKQIPFFEDGRVYELADKSSYKKYANGLRLSYFIDTFLLFGQDFETAIKPDDDYLYLIMNYKMKKKKLSSTLVNTLLKHFQNTKEKVEDFPLVRAGAVSETAALMKEGTKKLIEEVVYDKKL